jgi:hypothetical protein
MINKFYDPRKRYTIGDVFDDMAFGLSTMFPTENYSLSFKGQLVDTEKFDIIPKQSYIDEQIKRKEGEIEANERDHKASTLYYEERKRKLLEEKSTLLGQKNLVHASKT